MEEFSSDVSKLLDNVPKTSALFKDKVVWLSLLIIDDRLLVINDSSVSGCVY